MMVHVAGKRQYFNFHATCSMDPSNPLTVYISSLFLSCFVQHFEKWPSSRPLCVHAEGKTMAAVLLLADLYKRPVHVCHVARKEEVRGLIILSLWTCGNVL